jgi:8-oxo-dGTP pyrophosphatase MutT (NUDIX family)
MEPCKTYGVILTTGDGSHTRYALVLGRRHGKWSFPKGHPNAAEEPAACAVREAKEETGLTLKVEGCEYIFLRYGGYFLVQTHMQDMHPMDVNEVAQTMWATPTQIRDMWPVLNADVRAFFARLKPRQYHQPRRPPHAHLPTHRSPPTQDTLFPKEIHLNPSKPLRT